MEPLDPYYYCGHLSECHGKGFCVRVGPNQPEECRCIDGFSGEDCGVPPEPQEPTDRSPAPPITTTVSPPEEPKSTIVNRGNRKKAAMPPSGRTSNPANTPKTRPNAEVTTTTPSPSTATTTLPPWRRITPLRTTTKPVSATPQPSVISKSVKVLNPRTSQYEEVKVNLDPVEKKDEKGNVDANAEIEDLNDYGDQKAQAAIIAKFLDGIKQEIKKDLNPAPEPVFENDNEMVTTEKPLIGETVTRVDNGDQLEGPPIAAPSTASVWPPALAGAGVVLLAGLAGVGLWNLWTYLKNKKHVKEAKLIDLEEGGSVKEETITNPTEIDMTKDEAQNTRITPGEAPDPIDLCNPFKNPFIDGNHS